VIETHLPAAAAAIAAAVLVPELVRAIDEPDRAGRRAPAIRFARRVMPAAGLLAALSFLLPAGWAVLLVVPYAIACGAVALHGAARLATRGVRPASELGLAAAMLYLPAAAVWLLAHRAGVGLLGYPPYWVALTAAHFHVAGVVLPVVAAMHARRGGPLTATTVWIVVLGVPLTAIGMGFVRAVEVPASCATASGGLLVAMHCLRRGGARWSIAGAALVASMPLAAGYALGADLRLGGWDPLTTMAISHGVLNLVFAGAALAALRIDRPAPAWRRGLPWSRLAARGRVGTDWFEREGLVVDHSRPAPTGTIERLEDLAHPGWDPASAPPAIRRFFERTASHVLIVRPRWRLGFRTGARVWAAIARRLGNFGLPVVAEPDDAPVISRIVALDAARDGRPGVRGWVRGHADGRTMFVSAYARHVHDGTGYMHVALPVRGGHVTSILRFEAGPDGAVIVSTERAPATSDCGTWLVLHGVALRLPLGEEVVLRVRGDRLEARHTMRLLGVRVVELDYAIAAV